MDTLGHPSALHVTPADEQDRAQVGGLARQVQRITEENVVLAHVDHGYIVEAGGRGGSLASYPAGSGRLYRGQTRLRAAAAKMSGGMKLRLNLLASHAWHATTKDSRQL